MSSPLCERKRALIRAMNQRRAVGALLASLMFRQRSYQERASPMVATRDQLRAKKRSMTTPQLRKRKLLAQLADSLELPR